MKFENVDGVVLAEVKHVPSKNGKGMLHFIRLGDPAKFDGVTLFGSNNMDYSRIDKMEGQSVSVTIQIGEYQGKPAITVVDIN